MRMEGEVRPKEALLAAAPASVEKPRILGRSLGEETEEMRRRSSFSHTDSSSPGKARAKERSARGGSESQE
jgi:hypothetical protein